MHGDENMAFQIIALVVAVVALVVAYLAVRRAGALDLRVSRISDNLSRLRSELAESQDKLTTQIADLRLAQRGQSNALRFKSSMTISEALQVHPRVADILSSFHLGGCSQCAVSDVDTIEGACQTYGIDRDALMQALNGLLESGDKTSGKPELASARASNVRVDF
jgi:hybrid cluster-associated redox disulfide protein